MREDSASATRVSQYLLGLGYELVSTEIAVDSEDQSRTFRPDFVALAHGSPRVVVELASHDKLLEILNERDEQYHPMVRQAQLYAASLSIPYYTLSDGSTHLWYVTDNKGRPRRLPQPVSATDHDVVTALVAGEDALIQVLRELRALSEQNRFRSPSAGPALAILAKLLQEQGEAELRTALQTAHDARGIALRTAGLNLGKQWEADASYYKMAFAILDRLTITSLPPRETLRVLDSVFLDTRNLRGALRIPRPVAGLLALLASSEATSPLIDLSTGLGDILAAVTLLDPTTECWGIATSELDAVWASIQQVVAGNGKPRVLVGNMPPYDIRDMQTIPSPRSIISAPPFGALVDVPHKISLPSEDAYLELAVEWLPPKGRLVMLVPNGLLVQAGRRTELRRWLLERTRLLAVIGLVPGTLRPYSSIATGIIVVDVNDDNSSGDYETVMASLSAHALAGVQDMNVSDAPEVAAILRAIKSHAFPAATNEQPTVWSVPASQLDPNDLAVTRYKPPYFIARGPGYPVVPLQDLCETITQSPYIKLDSTGTLPIIGPAAVRSLALDLASINRTSEEQLPKRPLRAQAGDIVVNAIGTHAGEAAIVPADAETAYLAREVILVRPNPDRVDPEYLVIALNNDSVRAQFADVTGGIIPRLSRERLRRVLVPVPPINRQREIIAEVYAAARDVTLAEERLSEARETFRLAIRDALGPQEGDV